MPRPIQTTIEAIRDFNRYYTRQLALLERGLPGRGLSPTGIFVLREIASWPAATASEVARRLDMDRGYLSRLLKALERRGYIERTRSPVDSRERHLKLVSAGAAMLVPLDRAERAHIALLLRPLSPEQYEELMQAMRTVQRLMELGQLASAATGSPCPSRRPP
jgi:DNA-binding MarR family transcriptional regulator